MIVIAATNRVKDVDEALLRPGRFDWEISFGMPTLEDRFEILSVGARRLRTTGELPFQELALLTDGWSAARLSSIWTEAALVAAGDDRKTVSDEDVAMALERGVSAQSELVRGKIKWELEGGGRTGAHAGSGCERSPRYPRSGHCESLCTSMR